MKGFISCILVGVVVGVPRIMVKVDLRYDVDISFDRSTSVEGHKNYPAFTINRQIISKQKEDFSAVIGRAHSVSGIVLPIDYPARLNGERIYDKMIFQHQYPATVTSKQKINPYFGWGLEVSCVFDSLYYIYTLNFVQLEATNMSFVCRTKECYG